MAHTYEPILDPFEVVVPAAQESRSRRLLIVSAGLAGAMLLVLGALSLRGGWKNGGAPALAQAGAAVGRAALEDPDTNVFEDQFSTPPTGIFTGHKHGTKGGRLTFGKGTFFNVFDPTPDTEDCGAGHYMEGANCMECPAGSFCPGTNVVNRCPEGSMSQPGASDPGDCLCNAGTYGKAATGCKPCPEGYFCPGTGTRAAGVQPQPCPLNSDSVAGQPVCRCIPTFYGQDFKDCKVCPENQFCEGGSHSAPCPATTYSAPGSRSCSCAPGFYDLNGVCMVCPADSYCTGGARTDECPLGETSPPGSKVLEDCKCKAGLVGKGGGLCKECPAGSWCGGLESTTECPPHTTSPVGSKKESDCVCAPGWFGSDVSHCQKCPVSFWCPGGATANECPGHATSLEGANEVADCFCSPGYFGTDPLTCQPCPANSFCGGGTAVEECPPLTAAPPASTTKDQCTCAPGYFGTTLSDCKECPTTSVCPGGKAPSPCPENSQAPKGSTSRSQCTCNAGYYNAGNENKGPDPGGVCLPCPANNFCLGGGAMQQCGAEMSAPPGAKASGDCVCNWGKRYNLLAPRPPVAGAQACQKNSCVEMRSVCQLQAICEADKQCRGFTFKEQQGRLGNGCLLKGVSACLSVPLPGDEVVWSRNEQPPDSVAALRSLGIPVPTCPPNGGAKVRFWQHCWPNPSNGWHADLGVGEYAKISNGPCDNDEGGCEIKSCGLGAGDLSSVTIPAGMRVILYDQPSFMGNNKVLNGPMEPGPNCLASMAGSRRGNWNDVVQSVKVQRM